MSKTQETPTETILKIRTYLVVLNEPGQPPLVETAKPTMITGGQVLFELVINGKRCSYWIKEEEIAAVRYEHGTIKLRALAGKWRILNPTLFQQYLDSGIIALKRPGVVIKMPPPESEPSGPVYPGEGIKKVSHRPHHLSGRFGYIHRA